jgi:hypothetical protein
MARDVRGSDARMRLAKWFAWVLVAETVLSLLASPLAWPAGEADCSRFKARGVGVFAEGYAETEIQPQSTPYRSGTLYVQMVGIGGVQLANGPNTWSCQKRDGCGYLTPTKAVSPNGCEADQENPLNISFTASGRFCRNDTTGAWTFDGNVSGIVPSIGTGHLRGQGEASGQSRLSFVGCFLPVARPGSR